MVRAEQRFGGDWTQEKLMRVRKYLFAYTAALKNTPFTLIYIDAFAGTGYREIKAADENPGLMFPGQVEGDVEAFHAGSARIALETEPPFADYYFIEQDAQKCRELRTLKRDFPEKASSIHILNEDANTAIERICNFCLQSRNVRGVLFLDPFGMNVPWRTIETVARTKAIDMWYLFPLGVGANRLLRRDGNIPLGWQKRLDDIFGEPDWRDIFYKTEITPSLFGNEEIVTKAGSFKQIADYLVTRLQSVFPGVVDKPLPLYNSRNNPLYLLCFAAGNERGAPIAVKIAKHILKGR